MYVKFDCRTMFKLDTYIAPLIMGYIDEYVKLRPEDFQISLWGGDASLTNLDLRLDVIEHMFPFPVSLTNGHIHELRIHVPWTNFGSESVVITINTIECVLKLRGPGTDDASNAPPSGIPSSPSTSSVASKGSKHESDESDLPPGYIQGYINKIFNNVNIKINNLILKFVEDDIVLSLNVRSAELYSVNSEWQRSFVELQSEDLVQIKICSFLSR